MKNLELLETHRRKVAFVLAAIFLLLMYMSISFFAMYLVHKGNTTFSEMIPILIGFIILTPFLYAWISFLACRLMHRVYRPVRESITNLEHFTTNVNHEFKTSLSEIISSLELGELTKKEADFTPKALNSARRLNVILDSLMPLAEYWNSAYRKKNTDIAKVFREIIFTHTEKIQEKNISLTHNLDDSILVHTDIWPLTICFQNILANATKYNKQDWEIKIDAGKNFFEIQDTGLWIEEENKEKIFQRKFRENSSSDGLWVWLLLVKNICDMYSWQIEIETEKEKFTHVRISF